MEQETNLGIQEALPSMPRLPSAMAPGRLAKDRNEPWDMSWDIHYTLYIAATNELSCTTGGYCARDQQSGVTVIDNQQAGTMIHEIEVGCRTDGTSSRQET